MLVNHFGNISEIKDTIFKNLRTRKVSYVLNKSSDTVRNPNPEREDINHHSPGRVYIKKSARKRNLDEKSCQKTSDHKRKKTKYLFDLADDEIEVNFAPPMKITCEKKSRKTAIKNNVLTPTKPLSTSLLDVPQFETGVSIATPVKRTYKKQTFELLKSGTRTRQKISNSSFADFTTIFKKLTLSDIEPIKKRRYSEKSNKSVYYKYKKQSIREASIFGDNSPLKVMTPKRTYIKRTKKSQKSVNSKSKIHPTLEEVGDSPTLELMAPKRTYKKRTKQIKPVAVMKDQASSVFEGDFSSLSSFSQDSGCISKPVKRPRGRPRTRADPTYAPFSDEDTTSTSCTAGSVSSSTSSSSTSTSTGPKGVRKASAPRPRPWWLDEEPAPDTLSEYELQRQRNIQQNLQMLRQIFSEKGFEEELDLNSLKSSKPRKTYSRHPLPPPRPKSERLEHSQPLDFSKLFKHDSYN